MELLDFTHSFNTGAIDLDSLTLSTAKHLNNFLDSLINEKMLYEKLVDLIEELDYKKVVTQSFYARKCKSNKITNTLILEYVRVNYGKSEELQDALKFFMLEQLKSKKDLLAKNYELKIGKKLRYCFNFKDKQGSKVDVFFMIRILSYGQA